jgi:hypothetical protein
VGALPRALEFNIFLPVKDFSKPMETFSKPWGRKNQGKGRKIQIFRFRVFSLFNGLHPVKHDASRLLLFPGLPHSQPREAAADSLATAIAGILIFVKDLSE